MKKSSRKVAARRLSFLTVPRMAHRKSNNEPLVAYSLFVRTKGFVVEMIAFHQLTGELVEVQENLFPVTPAT